MFQLGSASGYLVWDLSLTLGRGACWARLLPVLHLSGSVLQCMEDLAAVLTVLSSRDMLSLTPSTPRPKLLVPPYRVATNPG